MQENQRLKSTFGGNSEFLSVSTLALEKAIKAGLPTDIDGWGFNLEALKGNEIDGIDFVPERKLCTWEMSVRGEIAFNLVGKLYISFKPLVDKDSLIS